MPAIQRYHEVDPKTDLMQRVADDVDKLRIVNPYEIIVAVYFPPTKTKGGFIMTEKHVGESKYQGIVGLVVKKGALAFVDDEDHQFPEKPEVGDWVVFRRGDDWRVDLHGDNSSIAWIHSDFVKGITDDPDVIA